MDYISFNNPEDNNNNYKKYIIGSLILYIPLITFNIIIYTSIVSINNLINTQENIDYIHKTLMPDGIVKWFHAIIDIKYVTT